MNVSEIQTFEHDVLVIGAGYTGLSSALHLAEKGVSVVLLEASSIGFGGSGRNAGLVNAGIWKDPEHVSKLIGAAAAERFNMALRDTPQLVFELVERFDMQCHAVRCGTVHIAHAAGGMTYLEERYRQLDALGAEVDQARERHFSRERDFGWPLVGDEHARPRECKQPDDNPRRIRNDGGTH